MAIESLQITQFRNIDFIQLRPGAGINLIVGPNASGKTSLLEAIYCLSTGKSFRSAKINRLIQRDNKHFSLLAKLMTEQGVQKIGFKREIGQGLLRLNGRDARTADVAGLLPVALIEPNLHELIDGPPENRRRFMDWGVFHVEPAFNSIWNQFQRLLKQRNAALKAGWSSQQLRHWDREFIPAAIRLQEYRLNYLKSFRTSLEKYQQWFPVLSLITLKFQPGWPIELPLEETLIAQLASDRERGFTQAGPHRADLQILTNGQSVKDSLSRGQQKLLAASLILAQGGFLQQHAKPAIILVDDLAAELDAENRQRLIQALVATGTQIFVTATDDELMQTIRGNAVDCTLFHVEQGRLQASTDCTDAAVSN